MIVVADSGPLHYLILIEQTQLLPSLYREVAIPLAVMAELSAPSAPESIRDWLASPPPWLSVLSIDAGSAPRIDDRLDLG